MRGTPNYIRVDNGPEFISKELDKWAYETKWTGFQQAGQTDWQCLHWIIQWAVSETNVWTIQLVLLLEDAREKIRGMAFGDYNDWRPHSSLDNLTLSEYLEKQDTRNSVFSPNWLVSLRVRSWLTIHLCTDSEIYLPIFLWHYNAEINIPTMSIYNFRDVRLFGKYITKLTANSALPLKRRERGIFSFCKGRLRGIYTTFTQGNF